MSDDTVKVLIVADASGVKAGTDAAKGSIQGLNPIVAQMGATFADASKQTTAALANMNVALGNTARAHNDEAKASGNAYVAKEMLRHSVRSMTDSYAAGMPVLNIFMEQMGRLTEVAEYSGGALGKVGAFMSSGWGMAVSLAVSAIVPLIGKLFEGADASEAMKQRQNELASYLDKTTGKINAQVTALGLLAHARDEGKKTDDKLKDYRSDRGNVISGVEKGINPQTVQGGGYSYKFDPGIPAAAKAEIQDYLGKYKAGLTNVATLYEKIREIAAANPANTGLQRLADTTLTLSQAAQTSAASFRGNQVEIARSAVAAGTATEAQKKLVEAATQHDHSVSRSIELQVALATATTATEKARAKLALVQESGKNIAETDTAGQAKFRAELTAASTALHQAEQAEKDLRKAKSETRAENAAAAKAEREAYRQALEDEKTKLDLAKGDDEKRVALAIAFADEMKRIHGKESDEYKRAYDEQVRITQEAAQHKAQIEIDLAETIRKLRDIDLSEEQHDAEFRRQMGAETARQLIEDEKRIAKAKYDAARVAIVSEIAATPESERVKRAALYNQLRVLDRQYQADRTALEQRAALQRTQIERTAIGSVASSWGQNIGKMLTLQQGFGASIKGMWQGLQQAIGNALATIMENWLVTHITTLLMGGAASKAAGAAEIATQAAIAGAGGVASMAAAPFPLDLGAPEFGAAMAAAAGSFGTMLTVPAFDVGALNISKDQLATVHSGEMIIPANEAGGWRAVLAAVPKFSLPASASPSYGMPANNNGAAGANGAGSGSGGDTHLHLTFNGPTDKASIAKWLLDNKHGVAAAGMAAHRGGHR
ncbi:hypothetical protein SAMN05444678_11694 [Sphingomonas sp. YR710]|uniref:hypothetical protein n=1 Tax=Sphingomonas sp. YR710 TaxID=1882773 RepID=UPI0008876C64|nr:hypothetical protein [Sphingomonas sp. YR710]SDD58823.1 hypothetical protein SAMN05444678_11694 [Sphingomonas sp. YR710]